MDGTREFRKSVGFGKDFDRSPAYVEMEPLRIPAGWLICWNTLSRHKKVEGGDFGGSSVFYALNEGRRFIIDVVFTPEFDPEGRFRLSVEYQPWSRDERGQRRKNLPFKYDADARLMHSSETGSYTEMVEQLETWIARCTIWMVEGN